MFSKNNHENRKCLARITMETKNVLQKKTIGKTRPLPKVKAKSPFSLAVLMNLKLYGYSAINHGFYLNPQQSLSGCNHQKKISLSESYGHESNQVSLQKWRCFNYSAIQTDTNSLTSSLLDRQSPSPFRTNFFLLKKES